MNWNLGALAWNTSLEHCSENVRRLVVAMSEVLVAECALVVARFGRTCPFVMPLVVAAMTLALDVTLVSVSPILVGL